MINFVIGPPCAGKTTFIKATFPNAKVIDLWDYQKDKLINLETIKDSYEQARLALIEAIKNEKGEIVLEHTLLRAIRREPYIKTVKNLTNEPINCYVLAPYASTYKKRCKKRKAPYNKEDMKMLEIPTIDEGFTNVFIIK